jgi:hypothetical protein
MRPAKVLLVDQRTSYALELCRLLGRRGDEVHAVAVHGAPVLRSRFCARPIAAPPWYEQVAFRDQLVRLVEAGSYDVIYVCSEPALETLQPVLGRRAWSRFPRPAPEALRNLFSKNEVIHLVAEAGVPIPRTVIPRDETHASALAREFAVPIVVKGEKGAAAQLVRIVRRREDLVARYREIVHLERGYAGRPTLQEFIPGDMFLVGAIVEDGEVIRISSHRKDVMFPARGGATVVGTTTWHPELIASALAVFRALRYTGIGSLDFIRDPRDGHFKFLEINPRVWGSFGLSQRSVDLIDAYSALAQGVPVTPDLEYRQGVRYHRITGELRLLCERPWRLFGFLKDSLDPRVTSDLEWRDPRPYLPSLHALRRKKRTAAPAPGGASRQDAADVTTKKSATGGA